MAENQSIESGVFLLPLTGRRNHKKGVVVGWAMVPDDEFSRSLARFMWCISRGYAYRRLGNGEAGNTQQVSLHRVIYQHYHGAVPSNMEIDHKDRNRLNDLPGNLRVVTKRLNLVNRGAHKDNSTGFKGVYRYKNRAKPFSARIFVDGHQYCLGYFATSIEAALAVNRAHKQHYPDVDAPNVIDPSSSRGTSQD